jgi:hypothetical protein
MYTNSLRIKKGVSLLLTDEQTKKTEKSNSESNVDRWVSLWKGERETIKHNRHNMCSILKASNERERGRVFGLFEKLLHPVKWQTDRQIEVTQTYTFLMALPSVKTKKTLGTTVNNRTHLPPFHPAILSARASLFQFSSKYTAPPHTRLLKKKPVAWVSERTIG